VDLRSKLVKKYGSHSLAFSTLQDELHYFHDDCGFIAYKIIKSLFKRPYILVLGDPICNAKHSKTILQSFLRLYPQSFFVCISRNTASILLQENLTTTKIGDEHILNLSTFYPKWSQHKFYLSSVNKSKALNYVVHEECPSSLGNKELLDIDVEWRQCRPRQNKNARFLITPLDTKYRHDLRLFCIFKNTELMGYRIFTPIYRDSKVIGHYADGYRLKNKASTASTYHALDCAIHKFREENAHHLSLGLSPFAHLKDPLNTNVLLKNIFLCIHNYGNTLYPFKGVAKHKKLFKVSTQPIYCASTKRLPLIDLFLTYRSTFN